MPISPDAQRIVDRLAAVDVANPVIDRQRAENALREHFERLGLEPLPVRWCTDAEIGVRAAWSAAESAAWSAARSAGKSAAWWEAVAAAWAGGRTAARWGGAAAGGAPVM